MKHNIYLYKKKHIVIILRDVNTMYPSKIFVIHLLRLTDAERKLPNPQFLYAHYDKEYFLANAKLLHEHKD